MNCAALPELLYCSLQSHIHQGFAAVDVFCTIHFPCVLFSGTSHV